MALLIQFYSVPSFSYMLSPVIQSRVKQCSYSTLKCKIDDCFLINSYYLYKAIIKCGNKQVLTGNKAYSTNIFCLLNKQLVSKQIVITIKQK